MAASATPRQNKGKPRDRATFEKPQTRCEKRPGRSVARLGRPRHGAIDRRYFPRRPSPTTCWRKAMIRRFFRLPAGRMAMTTDGYVVSPLFFPGGDIGSLAVHGTVNDLAMSGAKPLYLSASFILEEGFPLADLQRIARSMGAAAREAGVKIVTGDTKVVERGKADGVFISTAGVGLVPEGVESFRRPRPAGRRDPRIGDARRSWRRHHVEPRKPAIRDADRLGFRRPAWPDRGHGSGLRRGFAPHARSDARRPRRDAQRNRPSIGRRHPHRGRRLADQAGSGGGLRTSGARSAVRRQ